MIRQTDFYIDGKMVPPASPREWLLRSTHLTSSEAPRSSQLNPLSPFDSRRQSVRSGDESSMHDTPAPALLLISHSEKVGEGPVEQKTPSLEFPKICVFTRTGEHWW